MHQGMRFINTYVAVFAKLLRLAEAAQHHSFEKQVAAIKRLAARVIGNFLVDYDAEFGSCTCCLIERLNKIGNLVLSNRELVFA